MVAIMEGDNVATKESVMNVGIRDLKNNLSRHLKSVQGGETITITDHGKPVARIEPIDGISPLDRLIAEGRVTPAKGPRVELPDLVEVEGSVVELVDQQRR